MSDKQNILNDSSPRGGREGAVEHYLYTADTFHCDFNHELCMGHLGNAMLNAADVHSTRRNFGMSFLNTINKTWVLSRFAIELDELPVEHTRLCIDTWVENAMRFFTCRNWAITSEDGSRVYGYGKSIWAMIDTVTREPQNILDVNGGRISEFVYADKECPIKNVSRVKNDVMTGYSEFSVCYSDIDVNGHLNSMKYVDHVLDTFSMDHFRHYQVRRLEVAYVAEGHFGDTIRIYKSDDGSQNYSFTIVSIKEDKETELCRVKVTFSAHK